MSVKGRVGSLDPIEVTEGVLQRETLSPVIFNIFIADIEQFLINRGVRGVSINHLKEILILAYADDIVILADNIIQMKKNIEALREYCDKNVLTINANKTKVMIFQKGDME